MTAGPLTAGAWWTLRQWALCHSWPQLGQGSKITGTFPENVEAAGVLWLFGRVLWMRGLSGETPLPLNLMMTHLVPEHKSHTMT